MVEEAEARADDGAPSRGAKRAHLSIERLSASSKGPPQPTAMVTVLRLSGSRLQIGHTGRCRASRLDEGRSFACALDRTVLLSPAMQRSLIRSLDLPRDADARVLAETRTLGTNEP